MRTPLRLLRRYVVESNLIESIEDRSGPHYASHFAIAKAIARRPLTRPVMSPFAIHRVLAHGTEMESFAGLIRDCYVTVGRYATPEPEVVPLLLEHWWEAVTGLDAEAYEKSEEDRAWHAWFLHFWFLWIHPFEDGNGRTSRLFLNMLRLRWGLPWLIAEDHEKWRYYQEISFLGETWFRKRYPAGIYPTDQFGRILDPKFPKRPRNLLAEYMDVPTGHVPMRYSIRSRK